MRYTLWCNGKEGYTAATHLQQLESKLKRKALEASLGGGFYHQRSIYKKRNPPPRRQVNRVPALADSRSSDMTSGAPVTSSSFSQLAQTAPSPQHSTGTPPGGPPGAPPCRNLPSAPPGAPVACAPAPHTTQQKKVANNTLQYTEVYVGDDASEPRRPVIIHKSDEPPVEYAQIVHEVQPPPPQHVRPPAHNYINVDLGQTGLLMEELERAEKNKEQPPTLPNRNNKPPTLKVKTVVTKSHTVSPVSTESLSPESVNKSGPVHNRNHSHGQYMNLEDSRSDFKKEFYEVTKEFIPGPTQTQGLHVKKGDVVQSEQETPGQLFCVKCTKDANAQPQEGWVPRGVLKKTDPKITGLTKYSVPMVKSRDRPPPLDLSVISSTAAPQHARQQAPVPPAPDDPSPKAPVAGSSWQDVTRNVLPSSRIEAMYDYHSSANTVLSFKKGDQAELLRKSPAGWWCVRIDKGHVGWVPQEYWQPVQIKAVSHEHTHTAKTPDESTPSAVKKRNLYAKRGQSNEPTPPVSRAPHGETSHSKSHESSGPHRPPAQIPKSGSSATQQTVDVPIATKKKTDLVASKKSSSTESLDDFLSAEKVDHRISQGAVTHKAGKDVEVVTRRSPKLSKVSSLEKEPWYAGMLGRVSCETLLKDRGENRGFLIRESMQHVGGYTLSVFYQHKVRHFSIQAVQGGRYNIGGHDFKDLQRIVNYYSSQPLFRDDSNNGISLGKPISNH